MHDAGLGSQAIRGSLCPELPTGMVIVTMTTGFGSAGSILTEQPPRSSRYVPPRGQRPAPARSASTQSLLTLTGPDVPLVTAQPSPPATSQPPNPPPTSPPVAALVGPGVTSIDDFEVVYDDAAGRPMIAFADGQWYDVTARVPRPISVRNALRRDAAWAGAVVQTVCLWMRSNPRHERSFDLATELALAVGELARQTH